jgi:hypothetical protein
MTRSAATTFAQEIAGCSIEVQHSRRLEAGAEQPLGDEYSLYFD